MMSGLKVKLPAILWPFALAAITALFLESPSGPRGATCCLLLGLSIPHFNAISNPVVCRVSQEIAKYSYGIYLMHCICIWWAFQGLADLAIPMRWTVFAVSIVLVPFALYHGIEAPMILLGRRIASALGNTQRGDRRGIGTG